MKTFNELKDLTQVELFNAIEAGIHFHQIDLKEGLAIAQQYGAYRAPTTPTFQLSNALEFMSCVAVPAMEQTIQDGCNVIGELLDIVNQFKPDS